MFVTLHSNNVAINYKHNTIGQEYIVESDKYTNSVHVANVHPSITFFTLRNLSIVSQKVELYSGRILICNLVVEHQ